MLSTFLEIVNRERALSFSAALCLLTVTAAAMPGVFQEDGPFENTSLWEGSEAAEQVESKSDLNSVLDLLSSDEPASSADDDSDATGEAVEGDLAAANSETLESVPNLILEPEAEPNEMIESSVAGQPLSEIQPGSLQLDSETPELLDASVRSLSDTPETLETQPEDLGIGSGSSETVSEEVETESTLKRLEVPSPNSDQEQPFGTAPGMLGDSDQRPAKKVTIQNSNQDSLLDEPTSTAQDENVYQGKFWVAPLTPKLSPEQPQPNSTLTTPQNDNLLTLPSDTDQPETDLLTESQEFESLPAQPYPEFDWSQAESTIQGFSTDVHAMEQVPSEQWIAPLASPQVLSNGYQPFAPGNPALGGKVELNPMHSMPLPGTQLWTKDQDFILDIPSDGSVERAVDSNSPMQLVIQESSDLIEHSVDSPQFGAYESLYDTPQIEQGFLEDASQAAPYEIPEATDYGWSQPHPMISASNSRRPLFNRFGEVLSRLNIFKLRSFKLCPAKRVSICQNQACGNRVTRGLLKNWFNKGPVREKAATTKNWLLWPPTFRPLRGVASRLFQPPTRKPCQEMRNFFRRSTPPTRGLGGDTPP